MARFMGKRQLKTVIAAEISNLEFVVKGGIPVELSEEDRRTMKFKSIRLIFPKENNTEIS